MTEMIETSWTSAKRTATGSEFSLNLVPLEFSSFECWYENPGFGLKVGFQARFIYDHRPVEKDGKIIQWPICLGIILIEGELRGLIEKALDGRASKDQIDDLVRDCYELIVVFIRAKDDRQRRFGVQPHIYQAAASRLTSFVSTVEVDPHAIVQTRAVLVF